MSRSTRRSPAVAHKLGVGTAETLRKWVRHAEVDAGARPGVTSEESAGLKRLRREVAELRRANEILKAASEKLSRGNTFVVAAVVVALPFGDAVATPAVTDDLHLVRAEQRDPMLCGSPAGLAGQVAASQTDRDRPGVVARVRGQLRQRGDGP
jgi:hypothetical protein